MSQLLWAKPGMDVDADIQRFLAGDDVILDREFIRYDIRASAAHAEGLERIGVLSSDECAAILRELAGLDADLADGRFVLDARFEDMHSAIEARLIERLGDTGKKNHTGRSRNDQVLVATRLWLRDRLQHAEALCFDAAGVALRRAEAEQGLPLPGY
ncbi:MAG: lyase family protein, partial [Silanimonas sp.]